MNFKEKYFSGRVIFDHLAKTGGQAVNAWLIDTLGNGVVTSNSIGNHRELIRKFGGQFSIISAHTYFWNAEGLDPRYQYFTLVREPLERVISWLYFLIENHDESKLLRPEAIKFIESDGECSDGLSGISNEYVEHFCRILGIGTESDEIKLANALAAIKQYDVVGLYHDMPQFLREVSSVIGIPAPIHIPKVNVTRLRPEITKIPPLLRTRLIALNKLDIQLFEELVKWKGSAENEFSSKVLPLHESKWSKLDLNELKGNRVFNTPDFHIHSAAIREGYELHYGQSITFDVNFILDKFVHELEVGIHIFDANRQWAFGINSRLLGQSYKSLDSGLYRASYYLLADLPSGKYTAGFGFSKRNPSGQMQELAWYDVLCDFQISHSPNRSSVGYSNLPATLNIRKIQTQKRFYFKATDACILTQVGTLDGDSILSTGCPGYLIHGPYISLIAGKYHVVIRGMIGRDDSADAFMDIVFNKGRNVIGGTYLSIPDQSEQIILFPFLLEKSCTDLEIRILVSAGSILAVSSIEIQFISSI